MYLLNEMKNMVNVFFPKFCPLCGKRLKDGESVCHECKTKIPPIPYRERMSGKWSFDAFYYRAPYKGTMGELVKAYKFTPRPQLAELLAEKFFEIFRRFPPPSDFVLTYVPPTFKSLKEKGFDHMKKLTKALSKKSGMPFYTLLEVGKQRGYQVGLSEKKRRELVRSKYAVVREELYKTWGKIILVDDVFTTGATVNECAKMLKLNGASQVLVYTLCRSHPI